MATEALSDSIEFIGAIQINLSIYLSIYLGRNVLLFNTVIVNFELAASTICCLFSELIILREIALYFFAILHGSVCCFKNYANFFVISVHNQ